ncbi:unnamed protein product, partial [marine sediment metagenome]
MANLITITQGSGKVSKKDNPDWNLTTENPVIYNEALFDAGTEGMNIIKLSSRIPPNTNVIKKKINFINLYEGHELKVVESREYATEKGQKAVAGLGWMLSNDNAGYFIEIQGKSEKEVAYSIQLTLEKFRANKIKQYPYLDMVIESVECNSDNEPVCALVQAVY